MLIYPWCCNSLWALTALDGWDYHWFFFFFFFFFSLDFHLFDQYKIILSIRGLGYDFFELSYVDVQICEERPGPITTYVLEVTYSADDSSSSSSEGSLTPTSSFSEFFLFPPLLLQFFFSHDFIFFYFIFFYFFYFFIYYIIFYFIFCLFFISAEPQFILIPSISIVCSHFIS